VVSSLLYPEGSMNKSKRPQGEATQRNAQKGIAILKPL